MMPQKQHKENLARTTQLQKWRYMQDVLNGMLPADGWALYGNPLFNRAAFEGYTRATRNYRQFSGTMAGIF